MIKAEIFPKTPRELRSNFQMMRRVLKIVYIDSEIYCLTIRMYINAFKKEKTDLFTTHPIFSIVFKQFPMVN